MAAKQKILIVDDDVNIAELISLYLTKECFDTKMVHDGESALKEFETYAPNLILLDLMLPGIDGYQVCREIRAKANVPIIMLSAKGEIFDKVLGLELGADDYIMKPFDSKELVARVKAHIERYQRLTASGIPTNDVIEIRGLKIDKTARRVYVNGEEKAFTTKEFDLLTFLAENPNHVFTKEEIFREIWEMESVGDIATVTVHIKKIREKIEDSSSKPQYIETIWGVGYRFKM